MCKCLSLSHIAKIHIILIKQTIISKKVKKKGDQVSDLLCPKLTELLYKSVYILPNPMTCEHLVNRIVVFLRNHIASHSIESCDRTDIRVTSGAITGVEPMIL